MTTPSSAPMPSSLRSRSTRQVARALAEDIGRAGDVTSIATIPEDMAARAVVVARNAGVISGLPLVAATFAKLAPGIEIKAPARDGASVSAKTALMTLDWAGPRRAGGRARGAQFPRSSLRRGDGDA